MIPVQFDAAWELPLDARGEAVRKFAAGLVVELDEESAAAAIAVGAARALVDLPASVEEQVGRNRQFLADVDSVGLEEALARLDASSTSTSPAPGAANDVGAGEHEAESADAGDLGAPSGQRRRTKKASG